ncbi:MAG: TetR family transcriptional regulator C-terminal domain-containing protein [Pseudomonadota bacterium]
MRRGRRFSTTGCAGLSKAHGIHSFDGKAAIYAELLESHLDVWSSPLRDLSAGGDPVEEILAHVARKRDMPRESRLFATEIIQNTPRVHAPLGRGPKDLVDEKTAVIAAWSRAGKIAAPDPHHLIFMIWSITQHCAGFDVQVRAVLGPDRAERRFDEAHAFAAEAVRRMLQPGACGFVSLECRPVRARRSAARTATLDGIRHRPRTVRFPRRVAWQTR